MLRDLVGDLDDLLPVAPGDAAVGQRVAEVLLSAVHHVQESEGVLALEPRVVLVRALLELDGVQQLQHVRTVQLAAVLQLAHLDLALVLVLVVHELERDGRGVLRVLFEIDGEDDEAGGGAVDAAAHDAEAAEEEAVGVGPVPDLLAAERRALVRAQPVQQRLARLHERRRHRRQRLLLG